MSSSRRAEAILPGKGTLILTREVLDQIDFLHDKVGRIEWCGILFYRHLEGDIDDPKSLVLQAEQIYPMDIGSEAYTEADINMDAVIEMDDVIPDKRNLRQGLIHTHHHMTAFFSGTDMAELHDSTPFHNFYLSLIVNFSGDYVARVAYVARKTTTLAYKDSTASDKVVTSENEVLAMIDMDIEWEVPEVTVPDFFRARHEVLKQKKEAKVQSYRTVHSPRGYNTYPGPSQVSATGYKPSYEWDETTDSTIPDSQGKLFTEKDITKNGLLQVGAKQLKPYSEVEKEVIGHIRAWLSDGISQFTDASSSDTSISGSLALLKVYFDEEKNEVDYPFFVNQMQRSLEDKFDAYHPGLISKIGTKILDGYEDNDVCTDLFGMLDSFEQYVATMADIRTASPKPKEDKIIKKVDKKDKVNKRVK